MGEFLVISFIKRLSLSSGVCFGKRDGTTKKEVVEG